MVDGACRALAVPTDKYEVLGSSDPLDVMRKASSKSRGMNSWSTEVQNMRVCPWRCLHAITHLCNKPLSPGLCISGERRLCLQPHGLVSAAWHVLNEAPHTHKAFLGKGRSMWGPAKRALILARIPWPIIIVTFLLLLFNPCQGWELARGGFCQANFPAPALDQKTSPENMRPSAVFYWVTEQWSSELRIPSPAVAGRDEH